MAIKTNQFGITNTIKGKVVNPDKGFRYDVQNAGDAVLVPGDCVKIKHVAGANTIQVEKISAATDAVFGVVQYESAKANEYAKGEFLTVAGAYSIVTAEANGAVNGGAAVEPVAATGKVATKSSGTAIGVALTPAAAQGDIILVRLA